MSGNRSAKSSAAPAPTSGGGNRPLAYSYVRLSTDAQIKGHGRQRQLEESAAYAAARGWQLVETLEDIGKSAFTGANVDYGALGVFLTALDQRVIPKGSNLIVESLDRLSRQPVRTTLGLFLRILNAGINLVTLKPQPREFLANGNSDEMDLIGVIIDGGRSYRESELKGKRVSDAWANKRSQAASKLMTAMVPAWLKPIKEENRFEKIPDRVLVVKSIFADTVAGIGAYAITNRLNRKGIPPFGHVTTREKAPTIGKSRGWHRASVAAIITNRAVLGECQLGKMVDGKRQPVGDPIKDRFPRIISDKLFYRAQQARRERRVSGRGRKGKNVTNLFSGLATCAYCGSRMAFQDKGPPRHTYLVCEAAKRGIGCGVRVGWRYDEFEGSFLKFVDQLDLPALIRDDDSQVRALDESIQADEGRLIAKQAEMERVYALQSRPIEFLSNKLAELQSEQDQIKASMDAKKAEREQLRLAESAFYESKEEIKSLIEKAQSRGQDLYKLRSQISAHIKGLVANLKIAPVGLEAIEEENISSPATQRRCFVVFFKSGDDLTIWPSKDDPLILDAISESEVMKIKQPKKSRRQKSQSKNS